jgi:hypothetical protein
LFQASLMENKHWDESFADYFHMLMWLNDNLPLRAEVYRAFVNYGLVGTPKKVFGFGLNKP